MKNLTKKFTDRLSAAIVLFALFFFSACHDDDIITQPGLIIPPEPMPVLIFSAKTGTITEGDTTGIIIKLKFSIPATSDITILVGGPYINEHFLYGGIIGNVCNTNPKWIADWDEGYIPITLPKDSTSAHFVVIPINNNVNNPDYPLNFYVSNVFSGQGWFLAHDEYTLTILDDD